MYTIINAVILQFFINSIYRNFKLDDIKNNDNKSYISTKKGKYSYLFDMISTLITVVVLAPTYTTVTEIFSALYICSFIIEFYLLYKIDKSTPFYFYLTIILRVLSLMLMSMFSFIQSFSLTGVFLAVSVILIVINDMLYISI